MEKRTKYSLPKSFTDEEKGFCSLVEWEAMKLYPNPPQEDEVFYFCCQCDSVINPLKVKEKGFCPNCKTSSLKNFLCLFCQTILLNFTEEYEKAHEFCRCPLCKEPIKTHQTTIHACDDQMKLETERLYCPRCELTTRYWKPNNEDNALKVNKTVQDKPSISSSKTITNNQNNEIINEPNTQYAEISKLEKLNTEVSNQFEKLQEEIKQLKEQKVEKEDFEKFKNIQNDKERQVSDDKTKIEVLQKEFKLLSQNIANNKTNTDKALSRLNGELADFKTYLTPIKTEDKIPVSNQAQIDNTKPIIIPRKDFDTDDDEEKTVVTSRYPKTSQTNLDLSSVRGLVADILQRFSDKTPLAKFPLTPNTLIIANLSDTFFYYQLSLTNDNSKVDFAIPKITQVNSTGEFKNISDFYSSKTSKFNGKVKIEIPAQIEWDEQRKSWKMVKKGEISIV